MNHKIIPSLIFVMLLLALGATALTSEQTQYYWKCMDKDGCLTLLKNKQYTPYRTCALNCSTKAAQYAPIQAWCKDSDGSADYLFKGIVTTDLNPTGTEDYCYTFPDGKTYLMEGVCSNNKYSYIQKNCADLGNYDCMNGKCMKVPQCTSDFISVDLNLKEKLSSVKPVLGDTDLPQLLKAGALGSFSYTQHLFFENSNYEYVDYFSLGEVFDHYFSIAKNSQIGRYKLEFSKPAESGIYDTTGALNSLGTVLKDFEDTTLTILGREYLVAFVRRPQTIPTNSIKLTLAVSPVKDMLLEGETKNYDLYYGDDYVNKYNVTLTYMDNDNAKFKVNGEATPKLKEGYFFKFADGTLLGVTKVKYQSFAGGVHSADFFLTKERIILRDNNITNDFADAQFDGGLEADGESIDGADVIIKGNDDNNTFSISSIEVNMAAQDHYYVPEGGKLSDIIAASGDEVEVLFTNNWDIRLNNYDEASGKATVEIGKLC